MAVTDEVRWDIGGDCSVRTWRDGMWIIVHTKAGGSETTISLTDEQFSALFGKASKAEIERLQARVKELEERIEPFRNAARKWRDISPGTPLMLPPYIDADDEHSGIRVGDVRALLDGGSK